ncbi:MAG: hypothetical protein QM330_09935 [Acidobacteriota bacterium]|jgi:hypothetical protein|nr:hypothetical protein [Acidobacteriota bacterium]NLT33579.1 hypothetical protein [Acidobacteriota bacterium]
MSNKKKKAFNDCDWCGRKISYGNAMVTISHSIEQIDRTPDNPDGIVSVISSQSLFELCAQCGNRLNTKALRKLLVASGRSKKTALPLYLDSATVH